MQYTCIKVSDKTLNKTQYNTKLRIHYEQDYPY